MNNNNLYIIIKIIYIIIKPILRQDFYIKIVKKLFFPGKDFLERWWTGKQVMMKDLPQHELLRRLESLSKRICFISNNLDKWK